jgi:hypothetical protein
VCGSRAHGIYVLYQRTCQTLKARSSSKHFLLWRVKALKINKLKLSSRRIWLFLKKPILVNCTEICAEPIDFCAVSGCSFLIAGFSIHSEMRILKRDHSGAAPALEEIKRPVLPGKLGFELPADEKTQSQHIASQAEDHIAVFKRRELKIHDTFSQEAFQLIFGKIKPRFRGPRPQCLDEPRCRFYESSPPSEKLSNPPWSP